MALADDLADLRAAHPACESVLFGDMRARTVLCVSARPGLRQEDHDALLGQAIDLLLTEGPDLFAAAAPRAGPLCRAITADATSGLRLFLRAPAEPDEVFCALARDLPPLGALTRGLEDIMARYAA